MWPLTQRRDTLKQFSQIRYARAAGKAGVGLADRGVGLHSLRIATSQPPPGARGQPPRVRVAGRARDGSIVKFRLHFCPLENHLVLVNLGNRGANNSRPPITAALELVGREVSCTPSAGDVWHGQHLLVSRSLSIRSRSKGQVWPLTHTASTQKQFSQIRHARATEKAGVDVINRGIGLHSLRIATSQPPRVREANPLGPASLGGRATAPSSNSGCISVPWRTT